MALLLCFADPMNEQAAVPVATARLQACLVAWARRLRGGAAQRSRTLALGPRSRRRCLAIVCLLAQRADC